MSEQRQPGVLQRLALAFAAFFAVLFDGRFAAGVLALRQAAPAPAPAPALPPKAGAPGQSTAAPPDTAAALHVLALLQREGRLIDFLQQEIAAFSDAEVGAAARTVHAGCRKALGESFVLEPIRTEPEGAAIVVPPGFDAACLRLTGNVVGDPPFHGNLRHPGWRCREVRLPGRPTGADAAIVAPAEVELP